MVAVVIADVAGEGEYQFERRKFGSGGEQLRLLAEWLVTNEIEEVVMESTAQYWKPVWEVLERDWQPVSRARAAGAKSGSLLLAQAKSNRAPRGRKNDFADAERLLKRLVANELVLSFVPDTEQRLWRTVSRQKLQLTRARVRLQNQLEALLEQAHLKLSSLVSDLLGGSLLPTSSNETLIKFGHRGEPLPATPDSGGAGRRVVFSIEIPTKASDGNHCLTNTHRS